MSTKLWDYDNDIEDKYMHVTYFYIVKLNIFRAMIDYASYIYTPSI